MEKRISILGCGWLGFPLAIHLINKGWLVKGSTTSPDKLQLLKDNGIDCYLVQLHRLLLVKNSNFWDSEVLLINVPPSLKKQSEISYLKQMLDLLNIVKASLVKNVVFISSTSVYPEVNNVIRNVDKVDENSALFQSEQLFTQCSAFKTTVIRFGGLIGPGRHPSRFFAGKTNIPNGNAPVNLIYLDDCIGIIEAVLSQQKFGETYHAAAPSHPTRKEFYTAAARQAGLPEPTFLNELLDWKIIDPVKVQTELDYQFVFSSLMVH